MQPDIRETINHGTMTRFQVMAVTICIVLNMLDGFDVLAMAFSASHISAAWHLTGKEIGVLLSAGLFGMAAGSLFLAPWADRIGRRPLILICLGTISAGMLCSALAQDVPQLAVLRAVTGLGIGGMLASINVITGEYASDKWRSTAIVLQATGYPVGATIGGAIAGVLLARYGWRSVFVFGGLVTLAMIPVVLARLPESLDFLIARRPEGALDKLNRLLARMGRPTVTALPVRAAAQAREAGGVRSLFRGSLALQTLMIWVSFFLVMFTFYFVLSWTPKLLVAAGMSAQQGITGGVLLNVGGIVGGTAFAFLAARIGLRPLLWSCFIVTALLMVGFGLYAGALSTAFVLAILIGAGIFGCMVGLYAYAPILYPAQTRTTGMGWSIGMGRFGAVLAPLVAGSLLDAGWPTANLYYAFALPLLVAIASVGLLGRSQASLGEPVRLSTH
ncbi:MFS transporter [Cupriavidus sp. USMAA2-4]|uniref:MFS transporter n=1 Tax=Cupriavidus malaysiensis TaxID=367825 RepID=A0ABM6FA64_9BURK|nr:MULTISPECIES: MFS transporter [Cupriavidus]AOY95383.1 MFS transporter [Cupriavidus sp. USMAA2-4]AOZ01696.1 MFS transporter [Cupriavidus sp. USMAHM13]AOZ08554.1 MFS transporter [Cupriavidus malaysiensis]